MRGKLIKQDEEYFLKVDFWYPRFKQPSIVANTFVKPDGQIYNLSRENCDELFGIFNIENLIQESDTSHLSAYTSDSHEIVFDEGFRMGFGKATELNDKMFTLEEAKKIWFAGQKYWKTSGESITFEELSNKILSEPYEIEVEIEMDESNLYFDSNGCLILKRVV